MLLDPEDDDEPFYLVDFHKKVYGKEVDNFLLVVSCAQIIVSFHFGNENI